MKKVIEESGFGESLSGGRKCTWGGSITLNKSRLLELAYLSQQCLDKDSLLAKSRPDFIPFLSLSYFPLLQGEEAVNPA
jgi:hypothetical protein